MPQHVPGKERERGIQKFTESPVYTPRALFGMGRCRVVSKKVTSKEKDHKGTAKQIKGARIYSQPPSLKREAIDLFWVERGTENPEGGEKKREEGTEQSRPKPDEL